MVLYNTLFEQFSSGHSLLKELRRPPLGEPAEVWWSRVKGIAMPSAPMVGATRGLVLVGPERPEALRLFRSAFLKEAFLSLLHQL